ncbi:MAG TPA: acetyltransferase [Burkholderiales bacterium]|nr:acetyltransferase [Burkholderiales bacterium]
MAEIDVFNGDADGMCSLRQLRLAEPADSLLVTGPKRDIALLDRVRAGAGDVVTVLDISLERNRAALLALLGRGARVRYFDHHFAGEVPVHPRLEAVLDASPESCTSVLVDRHLGGRFRAWAVVGAFGDNLDEVALRLGGSLALGAAELEKLRELGRGLNYNAYGGSESDLLVRPARLYGLLAQYEDPLKFAARERIFRRLQGAMHADLKAAMSVPPHWSGERASAYLLPNRPSSRRVLGVFANHLARVEPRRAHAVLAPESNGGYIVSLRVPETSGTSADAFCREFPSGGGRRTAAGIDELPEERLAELVERFAATFG